MLIASFKDMLESDVELLHSLLLATDTGLVNRFVRPIVLFIVKFPSCQVSKLFSSCKLETEKSADFTILRFFKLELDSTELS